MSLKQQDPADRHLQAAVALLAKDDWEHRAFAGALELKMSAQEVARLRGTPREKAVILTAAGLRDPAGRETYFAMARKLNFDKRFPYLLLQKVLGPESKH